MFDSVIILLNLKVLLYLIRLTITERCRLILFAVKSQTAVGLSFSPSDNSSVWLEAGLSLERSVWF